MAYAAACLAHSLSAMVAVSAQVNARRRRRLSVEITASQTGDDAARRQSIVPTLVIGHDKLDHHNVSVVVGVFNRLSGITR